jgi:hypothetical protein
LKTSAGKEYASPLDLKNHKELARILNGIKRNNTSQLEATFKPFLGFSYPQLQHWDLEKQILFLQACKEIGIVNGKPHTSVMKCSACNSHSFCTSFVCTLCRSSNIIRGTTIQHDSCGNIDFDYKYMTSEGILQCEKCNKKLKAIGLDYSRLGFFYKCLECKAMLPNIDQQFICLQCGKSSNQDELQILELYSYTINLQKLDELLHYDNFLLSIVDELDRIGIKSELLGSIVGTSKIRHNFALVAFNEKNIPILVVDTIEPDNNNVQEMFVLSFIAKCLDAKISNRILLAIPRLNENLRELINLNRIIVVEANKKDDAILELTQTIAEIYNKTESVI